MGVSIERVEQLELLSWRSQLSAYPTMAKKHLPIPLALMEIESAEIEYKFGSFLSLTDSDFRVVIISGMKEAILLMATDSAQRILLHPPLAGMDRKKAKGCCDKNCSGCEIPLRSSATLGHFAGKRILNGSRKRNGRRNFSKMTVSLRWIKRVFRHIILMLILTIHSSPLKDDTYDSRSIRKSH